MMRRFDPLHYDSTTPDPILASALRLRHQQPLRNPRDVFIHYMVGGMTPRQAVLDVMQAQWMGIDAFVLNINSLEEWATNTIAWLFEASERFEFRLFFSFDMLHFKHPSEFFPLLRQYIDHPAYYFFEGRPVFSTFWGGRMDFGHDTPAIGWHIEYRDALAAEGIHTFFIPAFSDSEYSTFKLFLQYPIDGLMNWESWPWREGHPDKEKDTDYLKHADGLNKFHMMGISTHQYKHLSPHENWFRPGTLTLTDRMQQILELSPSFVQIQTWNDAGESHYIGNCWPNSIGGSPCHPYFDDYPHRAWQILYRSFISAYKAGARHVNEMRPDNSHLFLEGVFWYHPQLKDSCCHDELGEPRGREFAEDVVNVAIILNDDVKYAYARVFTGPNGSLIANMELKPGLNAFKAPGMMAGEQRVEVFHLEFGTVWSATGHVEVKREPEAWNLNYVVEQLEQTGEGRLWNGLEVSMEKFPFLPHDESHSKFLSRHGRTLSI